MPACEKTHTYTHTQERHIKTDTHIYTHKHREAYSPSLLTSSGVLWFLAQSSIQRFCCCLNKQSSAPRRCNNNRPSLYFSACTERNVSLTFSISPVNVFTLNTPAGHSAWYVGCTRACVHVCAFIQWNLKVCEPVRISSISAEI